MNPSSKNQTKKGQARLGRFQCRTPIALAVALLALLAAC